MGGHDSGFGSYKTPIVDEMKRVIGNRPFTDAQARALVPGYTTSIRNDLITSGDLRVIKKSGPVSTIGGTIVRYTRYPLITQFTTKDLFEVSRKKKGGYQKDTSFFGIMFCYVDGRFEKPLMGQFGYQPLTLQNYYLVACAFLTNFFNRTCPLSDKKNVSIFSSKFESLFSK